MKIGIVRDGPNIKTVKDYSDIQGLSEIAQILIEVELIKHELLDLYEEEMVK